MMSLILDSYGRPIIHPDDIIMLWSVDRGEHGPYRVVRVPTNDHGYYSHIVVKEAIGSEEIHLPTRGLNVKLLARGSDGTE